MIMPRTKRFWHLVIIVGVILLVGACLWCKQVHSDPKRVFWSTVQRGLTTHSVTIQAKQTKDGTTLSQTQQFIFGATTGSHGLVTLSQDGTTVQNETIGTLDADFTRYNKIQTDQKRSDGKKLTLAKIIGVWAKGERGENQLFKQAVLGTGLPIGGIGVPIGNVDPAARDRLIQQLQTDAVYKVSFDRVSKKRGHGRLTYTYPVTVDPSAYAALMKEFAKSIGLKDLDQLDPKAYKGQKPLKLDIMIDVRSHHVTRLAVAGSEYAQTYSGYDDSTPLTRPTKTITSSELQDRLANL